MRKVEFCCDPTTPSSKKRHKEEKGAVSTHLSQEHPSTEENTHLWLRQALSQSEAELVHPSIKEGLSSAVEMPASAEARDSASPVPDFFLTSVSSSCSPFD